MVWNKKIERRKKEIIINKFLNELIKDNLFTKNEYFSNSKNV